MPGPSTELYRGPLLRVGRFDCEPGHALWSAANRTGPWPLLAFPGTALEIHQDGRAPVVASANRVILYNPGQVYRRRPIDPRGDHCVFVSVAPTVLAELLAQSDPAAVDRPDRPFLAGAVAVDPPVALAPVVLARHLEAPDVDSLLVEERAFALLAAVARSLPTRRPATPARHADLVRAIERLLARSYAQPWSLAAVAAAVGCSPFHAARVFRAGTGATIHAYRHRLRLHAVLRGLADADVDLTDLALETGFASHSHLSEAFRRAFGAPPSRWRGLLTTARLRALSSHLDQGARARS